jgi:hypothetical protein
MKNIIHNIIRMIGKSKVVYTCSIALLFMCCLGCSKSEEAISQERFTLLGLNAITVDSLRLSVTDNGHLLTDSLMTPEGKFETTVKYKEPSRSYKVIDMYSNTVLFDSTISYKKMFDNAVTFFQPVSGGNLILINPPANEQAPANDSFKLSVVYSAPSTAAVYDELKVVIETSITGGPQYAASDSFLLKRGEFSRFFTGSKKRMPVLKLYSTDASRVQLGATNTGTFSQAGDISIYYLSLRSSTSSGATKLY